MVKEIDVDVVNKLFNLVKESHDFLENLWNKLNIGSPIATTITYLYPKLKMRTTNIYNLPDRQRWLQRTKVKLPMGNNFQILNIIDLESGNNYTNLAVYQENNFAILDATKLPDNTEKIMIITENDINYDILKFFVDVRVSEVPSKEEENKEKHWIVAAIKDETLWEPFFKQATFEDVEIGVGVNVDKYYSTVIKNVDNPLIRLMRANDNILTGIDTQNRSLENVGKSQRRIIRQRELKRKKGDLFSELAQLCIPNFFKNYIMIDNPNLSFIDAKRSENLMTLGNVIIPIPSGMNVILYTTLKVKESAQKGYVIFDRGLFCQDIEKVLNTFFR